MIRQVFLVVQKAVLSHLRPLPAEVAELAISGFICHLWLVQGGTACDTCFEAGSNFCHMWQIQP